VLIVLREKYCCLVVGGWLVLREKYCWLVVDKPSEQAENAIWILEEVLGAVRFPGLTPGPRR
jgi:hypothetical protein